MNLRFLPAAREELDAAASYLEDRVTGLGGEFLDDVERTGTLLCEFSQIGRRLDSIHREVPLQRFSFNLSVSKFPWRSGCRGSCAQAQAAGLLAWSHLTANKRFERSGVSSC